MGLEYIERPMYIMFHSFNTYESKLWLDGCIYYNNIGPTMIPGFLQYIGIGQFEACRGFEESLGNLSIDKLIERCTLVLLWLASSPELKGLNYRLVDNLFNKTIYY